APPALPARPSQSPQLAQDQNIEEFSCDAEYLIPEQGENQQDELYEEMSTTGPSHPPPVPFKPQIPVPHVPELPLKPILPQVPLKLPALPLPVEKETPGKSLKPWNSFRELISRPKVAQGDDRKRKISAPAKQNKVEDEVVDKVEPHHEEAQDVYELPETPSHGPQTSQHSTFLHSHSNIQDGELSDNDVGWSDEFDDDDIAENINGGITSPEPDLYETPEGGATPAQILDDTYEAPDTGFDRPQEPAAPRSGQNNSGSGGSLSVKDRAKAWGIMPPIASSNKKSPQNTKPLPTTPKPRTLLPSPSPKPIPPAKPQPPLSNVSTEDPVSSHMGPKSPNILPTPMVPPSSSAGPKSPNNFPKQSGLTTPVKPPPKPVKQNSSQPPSLPPKPSEGAPPALPPNHPRRDAHSDESGSAGSTSSGSAGFINRKAFQSELNEDPTPLENGGGEIYAEGISAEPPHPFSIYPWFHEDATKENADGRVRSVGKASAFLVRISSQKDSYTLVVFSRNDTYNMLISKRKDGTYAIGKEKPEEKRFESVPDFIDHHLKFNITLSKGGSVKLSKPAPRTN
ncbi:hypothetical protein EGW08_017416, partial [Elysia chlorotica]